MEFACNHEDASPPELMETATRFIDSCPGGLSSFDDFDTELKAAYAAYREIHPRRAGSRTPSSPTPEAIRAAFQSSSPPAPGVEALPDSGHGEWSVDPERNIERVGSAMDQLQLTPPDPDWNKITLRTDPDFPNEGPVDGII